MSSINGIGNTDAVQRVLNNPINRSTPVDGTPLTSPPTASDRLELSNVNYLLNTNNIRADKVADIRSQIDAGTYETDDKLNVASDRLLDELTQ